LKVWWHFENAVLYPNVIIELTHELLMICS
jgi:hypothetical protein